MTDPNDALNSLQKALNDGSVRLNKCELNEDLQVLLDHPNGVPRFTYAVVKNGTVQSVAIFALASPYQGLPCIQIGYAVNIKARGRGLGSKTVQMSIDEFKNGMSRSGVKDFFLEAVVSITNDPSKVIADRMISNLPTACVDQFTNEPALQYLLRVGSTPQDAA